MCGSHVSANVEDILWLIVCVYCSFRSYCCYVFLKYAHDCHHRLSEAMQPEQTCPMRRWVSRPIAACMMRTGQTMRMHLAMHPRLLCSRLLTRSLQQKLHLFVSGSTKLCQTCQIKLSRLHLDLNRWKDIYIKWMAPGFAPGAMAAPGLVSRLRVANATTLSRTILPWPHCVWPDYLIYIDLWFYFIYAIFLVVIKVTYSHNSVWEVVWVSSAKLYSICVYWLVFALPHRLIRWWRKFWRWHIIDRSIPSEETASIELFDAFVSPEAFHTTENRSSCWKRSSSRGVKKLFLWWIGLGLSSPKNSSITSCFFVIPNWVKSMRIQVCGKSILLPLNLQACCQVRGGIPDFLKQDAGKGNSEVAEVDLNLFQVGRWNGETADGRCREVNGKSILAALPCHVLQTISTLLDICRSPRFGILLVHCEVKCGIVWQWAMARYTDQQWSTISAWASMRMQTLWRTASSLQMICCHYLS